MLDLLKDEIDSILNEAVGLSQHITAEKICVGLDTEGLNQGRGKNKT